MAAQKNQPNQDLADILLKNGVIDSNQHQQVKLENINNGHSEEKIIRQGKLANSKQIAQAKAELYNVPFINLRETSITPEALNLFPKSVAERYQCFPYAFDKENKNISLAMANPVDVEAIKFVEQKTGKKVIPAIATEESIKDAVNKYYAQSLSDEVSQALKIASKSDGQTENKQNVVEADKLDKIIKEAPIAKIVSTLLGFAVKADASDIHFEPLEEKVRVRYRIDGILHEKLILPKGIHDAVVSRIKILSGMKIDEKRVPQDGRFTYKMEDSEVDLRVSSLPSVHGEKIVIRLLKQSSKVPDLAGLGVRGRALKNLHQSVLSPHGIVLVTGPTGSGKTTTLYSALSKINTNKVNIITLEDPVEYEIEGVNQVQVNPQAGLTFSSGLRSFLRQDPDIVMVGEIRDEETAGLAVQAALTGHLVFSTLHTNSAAGAIPRLLNMKAENYLLASSVICIVGQRVVRRICQHCKEEYQAPKKVISDIKNVLGPLYPQDKQEQLTLYRGRKCEKCNDTGYSGRIGIFEVLPITERIGRLILERAPASKIQQQAQEEGMITMTQDGYLKVIEGITTIEEVLRVSRI